RKPLYFRVDADQPCLNRPDKITIPDFTSFIRTLCVAQSAQPPLQGGRRAKARQVEPIITSKYPWSGAPPQTPPRPPAAVDPSPAGEGEATVSAAAPWRPPSRPRRRSVARR